MRSFRHRVPVRKIWCAFLKMASLLKTPPSAKGNFLRSPHGLQTPCKQLAFRRENVIARGPCKSASNRPNRSLNLLNYHFVTRPSTLMKRVKMCAWSSYSYSDSLPALDRGEGDEGVRVCVRMRERA